MPFCVSKVMTTKKYLLTQIILLYFFNFLWGDLIEIVRIVAGIRFMLMTCLPNSKITEPAKASSVRFTKKKG